MIAEQRRFDRRGWASAVFLVSVGLATGCGGSARPANPDVARKALQSALDGWKGGKTREEYTQQSSAKVYDPRWADGYKLLGYEIAPNEQAHGFDLNFQVTLRLEDPKGKKLQQTATYRVATSPRLVILRAEDL